MELPEEFEMVDEDADVDEAELIEEDSEEQQHSLKKVGDEYHFSSSTHVKKHYGKTWFYHV